MILGLSPWIINEQFLERNSSGSSCRFAVEFYTSKTLNKLPDPANEDEHICRDPHAEHLGGSHYQITAKVLYQKDKLLVLDIGDITVYTEYNGHGYSADDIVSGHVSLSLDPFADFDDPDMPTLIQDWTIKHILVPGEHKQARKQTGSYEKITLTHNLKLDESGNDYLLECFLLQQT